ncbi:glycosyltransferase-like protein [Candidatus Odyssella thessalonicensis]|uniref:glycosyltransferase-like protein n=1 Tax=Candidatus Odyssella thessalonicensis TaxID=84647 RepID=UPI000225B24D|nr:glycosyltransferase-like protein [Candidatus Odyssella thessalonicensis]
MEKIKVLFLTYYYPPQKCPRSIQISHLVQYLRHHFSLRVITSYPEKAGDQSLLKFTPLDNVNYAPKSLLTNFIEKSKGDRIKKAVLPDFQYLWHRDLYSKTKRIIEEAAADIIVTFGQPMSTHIAGLKLKEKYPHLKWLAHFSDPWIDNLFNDYTRWVEFANTCYQNAVFKNADRLIFTSPETIELVMRKYASEIHSKALYLPHIFDENLYHSQKKEKKEGSFLKSDILVIFMGLANQTVY